MGVSIKEEGNKTMLIILLIGKAVNVFFGLKTNVNYVKDSQKSSCSIIKYIKIVIGTSYFYIQIKELIKQAKQ